MTSSSKTVLKQAFTSRSKIPAAPKYQDTQGWKNDGILGGNANLRIAGDKHAERNPEIADSLSSAGRRSLQAPVVQQPVAPAVAAQPMQRTYPQSTRPAYTFRDHVTGTLQGGRYMARDFNDYLKSVFTRPQDSTIHRMR